MSSPPVSQAENSKAEAGKPEFMAHEKKSKFGLIPVAVVLTVLAAAGSAIFIYCSQPNDPSVADRAEEKREEHAPTEAAEAPAFAEIPPAAVLPRLDQWLRDERFKDALDLCRATLAKPGELPFSQLRYRQALCHEALAQWRQAEEIYRELSAVDDFTPLAIAAQLGQVRTWVGQGKYDDARRHLGKMMLAAAHPVMRQKSYLGEIYHMRARLEMIDGYQRVVVDPSHWNGIADLPATTDLGRYVGWSDALKAPLPKTDFVGGMALRRNNLAPEQHLLTIGRDAVPLPELLAQIAEKIGLFLWVVPEAEEKLAASTFRIHVENLPLADILSATLEPLGIDWVIEDGAISLTLAATPNAQTSHLGDNRRRLFQRALTVAPDHPDALSTRLHLANIDFQQGKFREASENYRRLLTDGPHRVEALPATFNLGLTYLRLSEFRRAREQFLQVIDLAPQDRWLALAWWWTARSYLDANEIDAAIAPFQKALKYAKPNDLRPMIAMALSMVHLLKLEPVEAHNWLIDDRKAVLNPAYRNTAAFLDAFAHYQLARQKARASSREREVLLQAVQALEEFDLLGPAQTLLCGQACRELHAESLMAYHYEKPLAYLRGPLAIRLTFELADYERESGLTPGAKEKYRAVTVADVGDWSNRARLHLADFALQEGKPNDCIKLCREILRREKFKDEALVRLGKALQQQGRHALAAECFAGRLPW